MLQQQQYHVFCFTMNCTCGSRGLHVAHIQRPVNTKEPVVGRFEWGGRVGEGNLNC